MDTFIVYTTIYYICRLINRNASKVVDIFVEHLIKTLNLYFFSIMKLNKFILGFFALSLAFSLGFVSPAVKTYTVNPTESSVAWLGKKVTGQHNGTINLQSGNIEFTDGKLSGGSFVIDMTTIADTDIGNEGMRSKLEGHLKSADFFDATNHPTAKFVIKEVSAGKGGSYSVTGDMTIKGITQSITFDAAASLEGDKVIATAELVVDRSKFDVRYGSGSFFDNLGDKTIYDDFTLTIKLVAA